LAFNPEAGTNRCYVLGTMIALLNAGLCATIGLLLSRRLERPD
jgi:hypothetical protein